MLRSSRTARSVQHHMKQVVGSASRRDACWQGLCTISTASSKSRSLAVTRRSHSVFPRKRSATQNPGRQDYCAKISNSASPEGLPEQCTSIYFGSAPDRSSDWGPLPLLRPTGVPNFQSMVFQYSEGSPLRACFPRVGLGLLLALSRLCADLPPSVHQRSPVRYM